MKKDIFKPGAIVNQDGKNYLMVNAIGSKFVMAIPITSKYNSLDCSHSGHIIIPSNLKTAGIMCLHQLIMIKNKNLKYIEEINGLLLSYIQTRINSLA